MIRQFILGPDDSHVAIVQFSNDASVVFDLHEDNQDQERVSDFLISSPLSVTYFHRMVMENIGKKVPFSGYSKEVAPTMLSMVICYTYHKTCLLKNRKPNFAHFMFEFLAQ